MRARASTGLVVKPVLLHVSTSPRSYASHLSPPKREGLDHLGRSAGCQTLEASKNSTKPCRIVYSNVGNRNRLSQVWRSSVSDCEISRNGVNRKFARSELLSTKCLSRSCESSDDLRRATLAVKPEEETTCGTVAFSHTTLRFLGANQCLAHFLPRASQWSRGNS